jgi:Tol biopolymer transport system component
MDLDGGNLKQLTDAGGSGAPFVSPDGKWVIYQKTTVWKVGIDGGAPIQLTDAPAERPVISPDGKFFACAYGTGAADSPLKLAVFPIAGGQPVQVLELPAIVESRSFRWSSDGKAIIYVDSRDKIYNLWSQNLNGGAPKQLSDLKSDRVFRFDVSRKGFGFALARGHESSDVIMIDNITE